MDDAPTTTRHTNHHQPVNAARTGRAWEVPPSDPSSLRPQSVVRARLRPPRERCRRGPVGMRKRVARLGGRTIAAAVVSRDERIRSQSASRCVVVR